MADIHAIVRLWYPVSENTQSHAMATAASELDQAGLTASEITSRLKTYKDTPARWEVAAEVFVSVDWQKRAITREDEAEQYLDSKINPLAESGITILLGKTEFDAVPA